MSRRRQLSAALPLAAALALFAWAASVPYDRAALVYDSVTSVRVTARDGTPLRVTLGAAGTRAEWVPLADISPQFVTATLLAEDRRFWRHPGVDAMAVARAAWTNACKRRVAAGGSTITQQLAGLLWPEPRTLTGKGREAVRALRLEMDFSKRAILEHYLNRLPYGAGSTGVGAASRAWFDRAPGALSAGQAATLAALPQAPARLTRPEGRARWRARRDAILTAMVRRGALDSEEAKALRQRDLEIDTEPMPFAAPHFADWVLATRPPGLSRAARLETTLDAELQAEVEGIVSADLATLRRNGVQEMAVVVLAIESGGVRALVGSPDWDASQVNGALALRQPGSALKPFVYAQAFAAGLSAADVLADLPLAALDPAGGEIAPRNYDGRFHGPVRLREALGSSLNVPAVRLQHRLGTERVLRGLRAAGLETLDAGADHYGLGLVLGVGEVSLLDLANAYAGIARGGIWQAPAFVQAAFDARGGPIPLPSAARHRWLDPAASFLVADVLADDAARVAGFGSRSVLDLPFPVVVKTGTSTDFRNAWCVGFDAEHVVGVWAGNFDASPVHGLAGATGAGPTFRHVMLRLRAHGSSPWSGVPPAGWKRESVCSLSGGRPNGACAVTTGEWFAPNAWAHRERCTFHVRAQGRTAVAWPAEYATWARVNGLASPEGIAAASAAPPRIVSPLDGSVFYRDPRLASSGIRFAAESSQRGDVWILDGRRLVATEAQPFFWVPEPGPHCLQLRRAGACSEVRFVVR
jgi:penicillin-binding protein 1C